LLRVTLSSRGQATQIPLGKWDLPFRKTPHTNCGSDGKMISRHFTDSTKVCEVGGSALFIHSFLFYIKAGVDLLFHG
jgi:hypothetical protein